MRQTPSGRQPHSRAVVGASIPVRDNGYASAGAPKGFSLASLETFGHRSWRDSWELHFWLSRKKQPPFFSPPFPPHTQPFVFPLHEPQKLFIINPF